MLPLELNVIFMEVVILCYYVSKVVKSKNEKCFNRWKKKEIYNNIEKSKQTEKEKIFKSIYGVIQCIKINSGAFRKK